MRFYFCCIVLLGLVSFAHVTTALELTKQKMQCNTARCRHEVGFRIIQAETNGRKVNIAVWYPTDVPPKAITYGTAKVPGMAARDAPPKKGKWPLVIFVHGYSGSSIGSATLAETVTRYGFIWAAPDISDEATEVRISGNVTGDIRQALHNLGAKPPSLPTYGYRIDETRLTLDSILTRSEFEINHDQIALAGHSLGGWTAMHLLRMDERFRAVILYSMGELNYLFKQERFFSPEELSQLKVPAFFLYGSEEFYAVEKYGPPNSIYSYRNTNRAPACLVEIRGGNHFVYIDRAVARENGGTPLQIQRIGEATVSFLGHYLLGLGNKVIADQCK